MFWDLAPCELSLEIEAAGLRRKDEAERDLVLAWMVAALTTQAQAGKLKDLRTLLETGKPHQQSREEQRQMLMVLSEQYHIPLRTMH